MPYLDSTTNLWMLLAHIIILHSRIDSLLLYRSTHILGHEVHAFEILEDPITFGNRLGSRKPDIRVYNIWKVVVTR